MKKAILTLVTMTLVAAATIGSAAGQRRHSGQNLDRHFFLPPRNFFFVNPFHYPPLIYYPQRHFGHRGIYRGPYVYRGPRSPFIDGGSVFGYDPYPGDPRDEGIYTIYVPRPIRSEVVRANTSDVIFQVTPPRAMVFIDGKLIGSARDFSTERDRYMLIAGEHELRIEFPGYKPFVTRMTVVPNKTLHLDIELEEN